MAFRTGTFATVWEIRAGKGNYTDVRLSTSKKNKQTEQYETDFSGWVRFVGTAHQNAAALGEKSRIKIGDCEVSNHYDKERNTTYYNFAVFSFEDGNSNQGNNVQKPRPTSNDFVNIPDGDADELPFE